MPDYHFTHLGPKFFDEGTEYDYLPPLKSVMVSHSGKKEVCACPLCDCREFLTVGKLSIDMMIENWVKRCAFNPIADDYRHLYLEKRRCQKCGLYFYNYHLPDSEDLYEQIMAKVPYYSQYRWEFGAASAYLEKVKPYNLIEIGAGTGSFLERVRYLIPEVLASEYNVKAAEICRQKGLDVSNSDIADLTNEFEVACAFEVLEHIWVFRSKKTIQRPFAFCGF